MRSALPLELGIVSSALSEFNIVVSNSIDDVI
jgi:RIO-like serine/threonine protein kinase